MKRMQRAVGADAEALEAKEDDIEGFIGSARIFCGENWELISRS